ncbi:hypothetical protein KEJ18_01035 [Candidatus Bathyarchaeota archaeon]|nr:hypothetical protein [Candidatus Bathyarchaeota archaeon]
MKQREEKRKARSVMKAKEENLDIFQMLSESAKRRKEEKARILESFGLKNFFDEGNITINMRTCKGAECKLCIKACPTNALYWGYGQVKIIEELCLYCAACVLNCIVDNCITISRKRIEKKTEKFGTPREAFMLLNILSSTKRAKIIEKRFPSQESYLEIRIREILQRTMGNAKTELAGEIF